MDPSEFASLVTAVAADEKELYDLENIDSSQGTATEPEDVEFSDGGGGECCKSSEQLLEAVPTAPALQPFCEDSKIEDSQF